LTGASIFGLFFEFLAGFAKIIVAGSFLRKMKKLAFLAHSCSLKFYYCQLYIACENLLKIMIPLVRHDSILNVFLSAFLTS
jgi:hypothetical protein